jgi:hypothetical protein
MESSNFLSVPPQHSTHSRSCSETKLNRLSYSTFDSEGSPNILDLSNSEDTLSRSSMEQEHSFLFKKHGSKPKYSMCEQVTPQKQDGKMVWTKKDRDNDKEIS